MPNAKTGGREVGEVPTRRDQSTSLAAIVAVVYALVLGDSVIGAGHAGARHIWLSPFTPDNRTATLATLVVFVAAGWEFLAYSLNIGRFPYKVRWLPDELGSKKPKTGSEEARFAIDLLIAVGFGGLLVLSETPSSYSLFRFLAVLFAIDLLSLASDVLATHRWILPRYRLWLDIPFLSSTFLIAYAITWAVVPSRELSGLNQIFLAVLVVAIVARQITRRSLAKRFFSAVGPALAHRVTTSKARVYLAGPSGFTDSGLLYHKAILRPMLIQAGFELLDPWEVEDDELQRVLSLSDGPQRDDQLREANRKLGCRNQDLIDEAGTILALLDGSDVDSGTAAEVGYAAARGIPVIGLRTDTRPSGDNEATDVNLQIQWFIELSRGVIVFNLREAIDALNELSDAARRS